MSSLGAQLSQQRPWITWEEVKDMAQHNISFGSHTHNHVILTNTSTKHALEEIVSSKNILSEQIGVPVTLFSYPNGNYNSKVMTMLKAQGFEIAVTTQSGPINKSDNLLALRRFMIHNDMTNTIPMLAYRLAHRISLSH